MTPGKAAAQAGHAFLDSFLRSPLQDRQAYLNDGGTKIVLTVPDEAALSELFFRARKAGLPCAMVIEQDHVMPPHFDGSPVPTAVGIGPIARDAARAITRDLPLLK